MELIVGPDGSPRCWWGASTPDYIGYHDREWGFGAAEDRRLLEKICLEGFQAGLSWLTILRKREHFRKAFADFDPVSVARFDESDVERLLDDAGIVRHAGKIRSTINNARKALDLIEEQGSLAVFFWRFADLDSPAPTQIPSTTPVSTELSKTLKRRGWTFVGPTTLYAFMQATGLVNDHLEGCHVREDADRSRQATARQVLDG